MLFLCLCILQVADMGTYGLLLLLLFLSDACLRIVCRRAIERDISIYMLIVYYLYYHYYD